MNDASFQMALLSGAALVGILGMVLAARAGYRSADRQIKVDDMLSRKHVKHVSAMVESTSSMNSKATVLVKEGADGDMSEAEKEDD